MTESLAPAPLSRMPRGGGEPAVWCVLALLAGLLQAPSGMRPRLQNDSFQYLSSAKELRSAQGMRTSLVYFDTERSHGIIPAPITWFPPGYSAAIAAVSAIGLGYERAALAISLACFALVAGGLWLLTRKIGGSVWTARAAVICWLANSQALEYSVSALSEALFTALGLASILLLLDTEEAEAGARREVRWLGSALLAGASYWVRYAGLLMIAAFLGLLAAQIVLGRGRRRASARTALYCGALLLMLVLPLCVRNTILVGDWRGGNNSAPATSIAALISETPRAFEHLVLGDASLVQLRPGLALLLTGAAAMALRARNAKRAISARQAMARLSPVTNPGMVLGAVLIYCAGIAAVAVRSPMSYGARMYFPVLPHLIALMACGVAYVAGCAPAVRHTARFVPALFILGYGMANAASRASLGPDRYEKTAQALNGTDDAGRSFKEVLDRNLKPGEVISATNGQAAGYALQHPTLALVERRYSAVKWNAPVLRRELVRFGAAHLLVFRDPGLDSVIRESRFLGALAAGQSPPWLVLVGFNRGLYLYRVEPDAPLR